MKRLSNKGFTIIELLIATVIFSVILLVITAAIVQFGRLYYKGVIQSRTQETARAISQDITQSIQFSSVTPSKPNIPGAEMYCIGNRTYTFIRNSQLGAVPHVLVSDTIAGSPCGAGYSGMSNAGVTGTARELLGENMQLVNLSVAETTPGSGLWQVTVHVAYGEDADLLADKTGCQPLILGGQFCAVSSLTTTVTQRLK